MTHRSPWSNWRITVTVLFLLAVGLTALKDVANEMQHDMSAGQRVAALTELTYAIAGLLAAVGYLRRAPWARPALYVWCVFSTFTAGLATIVWGHADIKSAIGASAGGVIISLLILWVTKGQLENPEIPV
ncbi:MAG: hypothetical protein V4550_04670 [Gemmatimonadota bacterium]